MSVLDVIKNEFLSPGTRATKPPKRFGLGLSYYLKIPVMRLLMKESSMELLHTRHGEIFARGNWR